MAFDNIINKFKESTQKAADQMGKAAKIARLKMDIMTLTGEKTRHLQTIGEKTYALFCESNNLNGGTVTDKVRHELTQIERIEGKVRELEGQIADLQAMTSSADVTDAEEVKDVTEENKAASSSGTNEQ